MARKLKTDIKDLGMLEQALTHRSYLGEANETPSNERLNISLRGFSPGGCYFRISVFDVF